MTAARPFDSRTIIVERGDGGESVTVQKCKLLAVSGDLQGREFVIDKEVFSIGSGSNNDLVLRDSTVSRRHCEIRLLPKGHSIHDLGSTNGTLVQGVRIAEAFLNQGSEIQLGNIRLIFCPLQEGVRYMLSGNESFGCMLGRSIPMRHVFHVAETYADTNATVLLEGETGTGKDIFAEELHRHSRRGENPFIVIDCSSLARDLVASELFGHKRGSFTGATGDRVGAFELADGGTVFLDEIGDLSPELQPQLLRVIEKREIRRVGSNEVKPIDVRIICATKKKLENEVNENRFREDLYFRLSVVRVELPPLRQRKEDIPLLTEHFLKEFLGPDALSHVLNFEQAMETFSRHEWPGNVRELRNLVEMVSYNERRPLDLISCLYMGRIQPSGSYAVGRYSYDGPFKTVKQDLINDFERRYLRNLLDTHDGNVSRAAAKAGIERAYLQRLIRKHGLRNGE